MQQRTRATVVTLGLTLSVMVLVGCAAKQPEAPAGLAAAEQRTAGAATQAEQAAQRAEVAAAKAEAAAQRVEQAAQRAEATAATLEGQFARRLRK